MAGERKRIEEIQKRKRERERAAKRRIYMIRRAVLVIIALALIAAAVFGMKSCADKMKMRRIEKAARIAAEEAAKPTPTPEPVIDENGINQTFYDNTAFVGNSFIEGMTIYELLPNCDYFSKVGLTVSQAMTESTATGSVPVIEELNTDTEYSKVFLMFGENEVGWIGEAFFEKYQELINKVKLYQPSADVYILAITPISQEESEKDVDGLNIDSIKAYNLKLKNLARQNEINFSDIYTATADKDGYLPKAAATDGIHFGKDYYIKALKAIQGDTVTQVSGTDASASASPTTSAGTSAGTKSTGKTKTQTDTDSDTDDSSGSSSGGTSGGTDEDN